jgi:hypothetical protein
MKTFGSIICYLVLTGCATQLGLGGGGSAQTGKAPTEAAAAFAKTLRTDGFDVSQTTSNTIIIVTFARESVVGTATLSPEEGGGCIPAGYSYSYSVRDSGRSQSGRRQLRKVERALRCLSQLD